MTDFIRYYYYPKEKSNSDYVNCCECKEANKKFTSAFHIEYQMSEGLQRRTSLINTCNVCT